MGVTEYFYKHFTGIKIKKANQLRFLNDIKWKYIYTLNIDTGIEESDYGKYFIRIKSLMNDWNMKEKRNSIKFIVMQIVLLNRAIIMK